MAVTVIKYIHCANENVIKYRTKSTGTQRLRCKDCARIFQEKYSNNGALPETRKLIIKMSVFLVHGLKI